jgi:hypothetical protein
MVLDAALFYRRPQSVPATSLSILLPVPFRSALRNGVGSLRSILSALFPRSFALSCILLQKSERHPFHLQSFAHSLQKHRGCHQERCFNSSNLNSSMLVAATPLDATLTDDLRVLPRFGRSWPATTPLDATLTDFPSVTPLSATLTNIRGGGVSHQSPVRSA